MSLPYAHIGVALATVLFVWLESRLTRRLSDVASALREPIRWRSPAESSPRSRYHPLHKLTVAAFYLWTGSQAMMLLPRFWVLALEVWDSRRARAPVPAALRMRLAGRHRRRRSSSPGRCRTPSGSACCGRWSRCWCWRTGSRAPSSAIAGTGRRRARWKQRSRDGPCSAARRTSRCSRSRSASRWRSRPLVDFQFKYYAQLMYPEPHALAQFQDDSTSA